MSLIRVLIVDDEPLARENLQGLLSEDPDLLLVGQCANGIEAVEAIKTLEPDLLFLDVKMPRVNGFEVLKQIPLGQLPIVIFVTAYDQHALRAFEVNALDYLLKPFDDERFAMTMARVKTQFKQKRITEYNERVFSLMGSEYSPLAAPKPTEPPKTPYIRRIAVKTTGRIYFVEVDEIEWIQAARSYVQLHTTTKTHLVRETMSHFEANLDPQQFLRIHRSTLINIAFIRELQPYFRGDYLVILKDGTELKLTRRNRDKLDLLLNRIQRGGAEAEKS